MRAGGPIGSGNGPIEWRSQIDALLVQIVVLAQLGDDHVRHHLATVHLGGLAPVNRGMPSCLGIAENGHFKIAGAYSLLQNLFELGRGLRLLIHAGLSRSLRGWCDCLAYLLRPIGNCARKALLPAEVMR